MDRRLFLATGVASALLLGQRNARAQESPWRHPELNHALDLLRTRQWPVLCALVDGLPPQNATVLLSGLGDVAAVETDLSGITSHPQGDTIAAALQLGWAWRARGSGVASTVTQSGWAGFAQNLTLAKANVESAVARDSGDGVARALGFRTYMGLSDLRGLSSSLQPFLMAARRPVGGFSAFANAISGKWLGSWGASLAFARQTALLDLPASAGLIPDVHFNLWSSEGWNGGGDFSAYLRQPAVRNEIIAANDSYNAVAPDPDQFANWYANANFSYVLMILNEPDLARPHFRNLGDYIGGPWEFLPDAAHAIQSIRHTLGVETL